MVSTKTIVGVGVVLVAVLALLFLRKPPPSHSATVESIKMDLMQKELNVWRGRASAYKLDLDNERRLRLAFEKTIPTTSVTLKNMRHAIYSAGFDAAVDTNSVIPK